MNLTASLQSSGQDGGGGGGQQDGTRVMVSFAPLQHRELLEDATVRILLSLVTSPSASMVKPKLPVVPREGEVTPEYRSLFLYMQVLSEGPASLLDDC